MLEERLRAYGLFPYLHKQKKERHMWNWFFRIVLIGPIVRMLFPMTINGLDKVPRDRAVIFAAGPHSSEIESIVIASHLRRINLRFLVKASYLRGTGFKGRLQAWFMRKSEQIAIDRLDGSAMEESVRRGTSALVRGKSMLVYPEGTRYFDGLLHPSGAIIGRMAYRAYTVMKILGEEPVLIYPVGTQNFLKVQPEKKAPRLFVRTVLSIGEPLDITDYLPSEARQLIMKSRAIESTAARMVTPEIMTRIATLAKTTQSAEQAEITQS